MSEEKERQKPRISRRQFLTYTLAGTAGFLGSTMLYPMVRFAIDPMLKKGAGSEFVDVGAFDEFSTTPKSVELKVKMVDGWYKPEEKQTLTAWVMKEDNGEILALSPICKHLGCTVTWEGSPDFKDEFFCFCHNGRYTKDGINIPGTPPNAPLDEYETKVENGRLLLGPIKKRGV